MAEVGRGREQAKSVDLPKHTAIHPSYLSTSATGGDLQKLNKNSHWLNVPMFIYCLGS